MNQMFWVESYNPSLQLYKAFFWYDSLLLLVTGVPGKENLINTLQTTCPAPNGTYATMH